MPETIVVPLDGSALAWQAVPIAARLARTSGGNLHLVGVIAPPLDRIWPGIDSARHLKPVEQDTSEQVGTYLEHVARSAELCGLTVTTHVLKDNPALAILALARQQKATLIVLCSHGETGLQRWMLGSVSLKVARLSPIPVLILRPEAAGTIAPLNKPLHSVRVLVPLDGSLIAEEALAPALTLTRSLSAPAPGALHLASVLPFYRVEDNMQLVQTVQDYLAFVERHIRKSEEGKDLILTSSLLLHIDIAFALLELAETGKGIEHIAGFTGCDAIAMATHGWGSVRRWILGSIMERVLIATRLPLLMVRPRQSEAEAEA